MLKMLAVFGLAALLLGWPSVSHEQQTPTDHKDQKGQSASNPVPPMHVIIEPSPAIEHLKAIPNSSESKPPEKPLPRFIRPEWVIVYITAIYVAISGWMLIAIKEQSRHTARQADLTKQQVDAMIAERRAQLELVFQQPMTVEEYINGTVSFSSSFHLINRGQAAANITSHGGNFLVHLNRSFPLPPPEADKISFSKYVILPEEDDPIVVSGWSEYAHPSSGGKEAQRTPSVSFYGFTEYKTLTTHWHRDFAYCWWPDDPYQDPFDGASKGSQIVAGRWEPDVCQTNQEYQIYPN